MVIPVVIWLVGVCIAQNGSLRLRVMYRTDVRRYMQRKDCLKYSGT